MLPTELAALVGSLGDPVTREKAATALARRLGGERLLLFAPDPELGVLLPAPGLDQVLRGAKEWRAFLHLCARDGDAVGTLPDGSGDPARVVGCALQDGTAAILVGPSGTGSGLASLRPFLPLLRSLFYAERRIDADAARANATAEALERANVLTGALQTMRSRLQEVLAEVEAARNVARERADEAEALAGELRTQGETLQEQALELEMLNDELEARTDHAERAQQAAD
ncbi:MAG TPA: hypothetical protein VMN39_11460, partial [Longimicrobiaceae bacterium]|nr:hypothetical protein [Longimicrobiaceae bacterium]